jgi:hypothetical protein
MLFKTGLRRKLSEQISRLVPTQITAQGNLQNDKAVQQELYESIALGNALAEIEDNANRQWGR